MSKLVHSFFFLTALYSAIANAETSTNNPKFASETFTIDLQFATGPGQPTRVILTDKYCISKVPDVIGLEEGKATFDIVTDGFFFSKCGWVHSSATFEVQNDNFKKLLVFKFYKDVATSPTINIKWLASGECTYSRSYVICGPLY